MQGIFPMWEMTVETKELDPDCIKILKNANITSSELTLSTYCPWSTLKQCGVSFGIYLLIATRL